MAKISFSRSQPWSDTLGKHTVIDIRRDGKVIGKITGRSGVAIPNMQYFVECEGVKPFSSFLLGLVKNEVRKLLTATDNSGTND